MQPARIAAIALGANLADRRRSINLALAEIAREPAITPLRVSSFIETEPVGVLDQPPFLNACALVETDLAPRDLLHALLRIERTLGRNRAQERRWGPRTIDLDLLLMGERIIDSDDLVLPHPRMHERCFVLEPLAQIAPDMRHPRLAMTIAQLLDALRVGASVTPTRTAPPHGANA